MSINWNLTAGDILTVQLNYEVFGKRHKLQMLLSVLGDDIIAPEKVAKLLGDAFIGKCFANCLSKNSRWVSITLVFRQGKVKLPYFVLGAGDLDMEKMLRLNRYNKDYPLSFMLYGIQKNIDQSALEKLIKALSTELLQITEQLSVCLVGFSNNAQITAENYVVDVSSKLVQLSQRQKETLSKNINKL